MPFALGGDLFGKGAGLEWAGRVIAPADRPETIITLHDCAASSLQVCILSPRSSVVIFPPLAHGRARLGLAADLNARDNAVCQIEVLVTAVDPLLVPVPRRHCGVDTGGFSPTGLKDAFGREPHMSAAKPATGRVRVELILRERRKLLEPVCKRRFSQSRGDRGG
jgi:hypothetical protein